MPPLCLQKVPISEISPAFQPSLLVDNGYVASDLKGWVWALHSLGMHLPSLGTDPARMARGAASIIRG